MAASTSELRDETGMVLSRLYPERPFVAASVAVLRGDRVLVASRRHPPMDHLYTLPGGQVEPGETLAEAALRELREEVGVEADMIGFLDHVEVVGRDEEGRVRHHFVVCAHAARWVAGEGAAGEEASDVRWVTEAELASLPTTAGLAGIVRKAFALAGAGR
jgi:8-oxo-dGTP diphosphatase